MQKDSLRSKTKRIKSRQVGRGGKRGKTSGRGHKGQKARAGNKIRPEVRDIIKKIPKLRGHASVSVSRNRCYEVNLKDIEGVFADGDSVTPEILNENGLLKTKKSISSKVKVKILATGDISKKLKVAGCEMSETAREKIEKAGGTIEE